MVALAPTTQIPSNINTVEKALVWAAMALQGTLGKLQTTIIANEPPVSSVQVQVTQDANGNNLFAITAYVPLTFDTLNSTTLKAWQAANDMGTSTLPSIYTSN